MTKKALVLIDVQHGFDPALHENFWGPRNNPDCEENIKLLLDVVRATSGSGSGATTTTTTQVIHVVHDSLLPDSPLNPTTNPAGNSMLFDALEGEPVFRKSVNSSFIGTELEPFLRIHGITDLICVGLTTDHCVNTTVRMGSNLGFACTIVADATACHARLDYAGKLWDAQLIHDAALASLSHGNEFCDVKLTKDLIASGF
jgi:nicotinamidase-related amidase